MTRLLIALCVCVAGRAGALSSQQTGSAVADTVAIRRLLDSARVLGLPGDPLRGIVEEGKQRGMSASRVLTAVRDYFGALQRAKRAAGPRATSDEVDAGASVLMAGADDGAIAAIRAARPDGNITTALVVLGDLMARGVPAARAEDALVTLTRVGASDAALHDFRTGVQHDLDAGQGAESSLLKRTRETVSRFQTGGRKGPGGGADAPARPTYEPLSQASSHSLAPDPFAGGAATGELRGSVAPLLAVPQLRFHGVADMSVDPILHTSRAGAEALVIAGTNSSRFGAEIGAGIAGAAHERLRSPIAYGALWHGNAGGGERIELRSSPLRSDDASWSEPSAVPVPGLLRALGRAALVSGDTEPTVFPPHTSGGSPTADSGSAPNALRAPGSISELRLELTRHFGAVSILGATGLRMLDTRPFDTWGALSVATWVQPTIAIVGGFSVRRSVIGATIPGAANATFGLRWQPGNLFAHTPKRDVRAAVAEVQGTVRVADHVAEFEVVAPKGQRVEVAGDFTNWSPVDMSRADGPGGSRWRIVLPPGRALVRLRVRIDGGEWIVPAGLARARDAFGDDVGALVIAAAS